MPTKTRRPDPPAAEAPSLSGLGLRIKHARLVRGLTLKELAGTAGCSESMLSKVERDLAMPSLAALHRLALALDSNVGELTASAAAATQGPIARAGERPVVAFKANRQRRGGIRLERIVLPVRGQLLQADIHVVDPLVASDEQISHAGEEMGYVLEGEFELTLDRTTHRLSTGDSFHFPSDTPHSYRNPGRAVARVLWVNTPPTF